MATELEHPNGTSTGEGIAYAIDPTHTVAEFAVRHMMLSTVKGRFPEVGGELVLDEADPTRSSVTASARTASVATGDAQRDAHLRSADFFDAERHPELTFRSRRVERTRKEDEYRIVGDLTMHGVTREVTFDATYLGRGIDPWGNTRVAIEATTKVNRKDYGLLWNVALEAGGVLVGDTVTISLDVQAIAPRQ